MSAIAAGLLSQRWGVVTATVTLEFGGVGLGPELFEAGDQGFGEPGCSTWSVVGNPMLEDRALDLGPLKSRCWMLGYASRPGSSGTRLSYGS